MEFPMSMFYVKVYGVVFPIGCFALSIPYTIHYLLDGNEILRFLAVGFFSVVSTTVIVAYFGISKSLRIKLLDKILFKIHKHYN